MRNLSRRTDRSGSLSNHTVRADLRRTDDGAVIHVRGKGGKDRRIPIEPALVEVLERYLDSRATRFPATAKRRSSPGGGLAAWPTAAPLFVGTDGERITRGTLQYRVLRAFRRAGIDADRARGALVHGLRHCAAARPPTVRRIRPELPDSHRWIVIHEGDSNLKDADENVKDAFKK